MNTKDKREQLRRLMADCPACVPADADDVPDAELGDWIANHKHPTKESELTDEDRRILRNAGVEVP